MIRPGCKLAPVALPSGPSPGLAGQQKKGRSSPTRPRPSHTATGSSWGAAGRIFDATVMGSSGKAPATFGADRHGRRQAAPKPELAIGEPPGHLAEQAAAEWLDRLRPWALGLVLPAAVLLPATVAGWVPLDVGAAVLELPWLIGGPLAFSAALVAAGVLAWFIATATSTGPGRDGVAKLIVIGRTQAQPQAVGRACHGCDDVPAGGASPPLIAACARSWRIACRSSR